VGGGENTPADTFRAFSTAALLVAFFVADIFSEDVAKFIACFGFGFAGFGTIQAFLERR
jgi:hypothetical protein